MSLFGFIVDLLRPVKPGDYFRMCDEKKRETPEEREASLKESPFYCQLHRESFSGISTDCYFCLCGVKYEIEKDMLPPGIDKNNCDFYGWRDYMNYHLIENKRKAGEISDAEARRQWGEYVYEHVQKPAENAKRTKMQTKTRYAQEEAQKRREYEEARKVYGIWTPH